MCVLMFRYLEACELNKLLIDMPKLKFDNALTNAVLLVRRYEKNIPAIMRQSYDHQSFKNVYKKTCKLFLICRIHL